MVRGRRFRQHRRALFAPFHGVRYVFGGCNDNVNKFIWNALAWDPEAKVIDVLRDYCRFFISHRYAEDFAQGLLGLEKAWQGPLLANENVDATLARFQTMERAATPAELELALPAKGSTAPITTPTCAAALFMKRICTDRPRQVGGDSCRGFPARFDVNSSP